jgi:hypothetical protein
LTGNQPDRTDLEALRGDAEVQAWAEQYYGERRTELLRAARPCPICGASAESLAWFWFTSSRDSWEHLAGRAGWVSFCDRDRCEVGFFVDFMN